MSTIHVACGVTPSYLLPLAVMLDSLKGHLSENSNLVVHLLHCDLEEKHIRPLSQIAEINAIRLGSSTFESIPRSSRFPPQAAIPLIIPELLANDLDRVLFLDADLLVLDDITPLWATCIDECVLAGAIDPTIPYCSSPRGVKDWQQEGIPPDTEYFNGGVLLMNLPVWRERKITLKAYEYLKRNVGRVDFLHQEALNSVLWNQRVLLHERWNLQASRSGRFLDRTKSSSWGNPGIVHFSGRMKPWRHPIGGPFQSHYQAALKRGLAHYPLDPMSFRERLLSCYDRYLRDFLFPIEELLWRQRWL